MTQPTPYEKSRTFADSSTGVIYPVPASFLDTEFALVERTVDEICTNLALIQRDDGLLANQSVHPDALNEAVTLMMGDWNPRGDWGTGRKYAKYDMARQGVKYTLYRGSSDSPMTATLNDPAADIFIPSTEPTVNMTANTFPSMKVEPSAGATPIAHRGYINLLQY